MTALTNSPPVLRPYQVELIDRVAEAIAAGHRRIMVQLPTGGGKAVVIGAIVERATGKRNGSLILAHRLELIEQQSQKLFDVSVDHGVIQAGYPMRREALAQVASVQTLYARAIRTSAIELPDAKLVIVDEAHHATARTYKAIIECYPGAILLGFTATPCRTDGAGLGARFEVLVQGPQVGELIAGGYLVPAIVYAPCIPDLEGVQTKAGDYVQGELEERVDTQVLIGDIVTHWLRLGRGRRTVVFAAGIKHAVHIRDQFRLAGIWAEQIDGTTPTAERTTILKGLAAGSIEVVCNAMVLTEGWDSPTVSCVVLARPTKSLALYRQMIGRVLRPAEGKTDALVLDHAGAVFQHGLPDEPVEWTLAAGAKAENPVQRARSKHEAPKLATCPECHAVRLSGKACTTCGWRDVPKSEIVEVVDGDLGLVEKGMRPKAPKPTAEEKQRTFAMLAHIGRERGYKPGWASQKYRDRFGVWPAIKSVVPIPPDDAMRSWVRSRDIAYAKRRQGRQVPAA